MLMDCIGEDWDVSMFDPVRRTLEENAQQLVELDAYSMLMVGFDLISKDAADYIVNLVENYKMTTPYHPLDRPQERGEIELELS